MNVLQKIEVDCYNYDSVNYKVANVVYMSRDVFINLVKELEHQLTEKVDYSNLKVNGQINNLVILEAVGKENILHVSRIEGI